MKRSALLLLGLALTLNAFSQVERWPEDTPINFAPMPLPYLDNKPEVINIDLGRQLFVDDYLIESSDLERIAFQPKKVDFNPIMKPETPSEIGKPGIPGATAKDGGLWWDPKDKIFKLWYEAGWLQHMAYATSKDGIHWDRPNLDIVPGTNIIIKDLWTDSTTAWLDLFTDDPDERYKMFLRSPNSVPDSDKRINRGWVLVSADGIHWNKRYKTGWCGDRSTMFYNPFRKKWVYSIRTWYKEMNVFRSRAYLESSDFIKGAKWKRQDVGFWCGADSLDVPDPLIGDQPQLYNLSAVGYESIMIALPQIHYGPDNKICQVTGMPKITQLKVAYSRDGYHWDRTDRDVFIKAERREGAWDWGYIQTVGGLFNVVGDQLWFHYIGFTGDTERTSDDFFYNGMHNNGSIGLAVLRRDGFVARSARSGKGSLTTPPVSFAGEYLFVNVDCPKGELRVEVLDKDGKVIEGYSAADCKPIRKDGTILNVAWKKHKTLQGITGPVKFRFCLENGDLYSFWVSAGKDGESNGFNAAGGPGFTGGTDTVGKKGYAVARKYRVKTNN